MPTANISQSGSLTGTIQSGATLSGTMSAPSSITINNGTTTPATTESLGLVIVGSNLTITEEGVLSVDVATTADQDNTKPITSAAVNTLVGNIDALLATI